MTWIVSYGCGCGFWQIRMFVHIYTHTYIYTCACSMTSAVFDPMWPYVPWPARLLCPRDFPSKNTEVGCHVLLLIQGWKLYLLQLLHCSRFFTAEPLGKPIFIHTHTHTHTHTHILIYHFSQSIVSSANTWTENASTSSIYVYFCPILPVHSSLGTLGHVRLLGYLA